MVLGDDYRLICTELCSFTARKYRGLTSPGAFSQRLTVLRAKPVRLEISLIVNLSRIFMRLTLPNTIHGDHLRVLPNRQAGD